ncbi:hypothetical protein [Burkholderia vietnamiensis]|uniref:hypothetical protein n=1 Tax=Burkholderia vietnamiensis TaxID=60552 RepID=UPI0012D89D3C|nr:hypothetical protein [Burkholderia vietnamiensis]
MENNEREIDKLWRYAAHTRAQTEAVATLLRSALPLIQDSPAFSAKLREAVDAHVAELVCRGVDQAFMDEYFASLNALLPVHLRSTDASS